MSRANEDKEVLLKVAEKLNIVFDEALPSIDQFLSVVEKMRAEGAVVLLKWDGERGVDDNGPYTIVVSGKALQGDFFRTDTGSLKEALLAGIAFYARKMWNILD